MTTPEVILKQQVMDYLLRLPNSYFWQNDSFGLKGRKRKTKYRPNGVPDVLGCVDGQFIGIELKIGKNKLSEDQIIFCSRLTECGGKYYTVRDIHDIQELAKINGWIDGT